MASWARRRKTTIGLSFFIGIILFFAIAYQFTAETPTCDDGIKNQDELFIDCGGPCAKVCEDEAAPLITHWSKVFRLAEGRFSAAALIENPNPVFGSGRLNYLFKLYDEKNVVVAQKDGVAYVNPSERFVIFVPQLSSGVRTPVKAFIELSEPEWTRLPKAPEKPLLSIQNKQFVNEPTPRLTAELYNSGVLPESRIDVYAVLSNEKGNAFAVSQTYVDRIEKGETARLVFTWPEPFVDIPVTIDLYPRAEFR